MAAHMRQAARHAVEQLEAHVEGLAAAVDAFIRGRGEGNDAELAEAYKQAGLGLLRRLERAVASGELHRSIGCAVATLALALNRAAVARVQAAAREGVRRG